MQRERASLKLDRAVIVVSIATAVLWIERGRRIDVGSPADAAVVAPATARCPGNDNVPYSSACIVFMEGRAAPDRDRWRHAAQRKTGAPEPTMAGPACPPNNENIPYSAACIKFMSGWFWQANAAESAASVSPYTPN
jgi:hypothetical protein